MESSKEDFARMGEWIRNKEKQSGKVKKVTSPSKKSHIFKDNPELDTI